MSEVRVTPVALGTRLTLKAGCVLVEDGALRVLVDAGRFGSRAELELALRASAGVGLADIDALFFTHLHFDHYNDLGFADVPQVLLPRREVEAVEALMHWREDAQHYAAAVRACHHSVSPIFMRQFVRLASDARYDFARVSFRRRMQLIDAGERITPNVVTLDLPGHCAGQLGLAMLTRWGRTVIAGDAALSPEDYAAPDLSHHLVIYDADQLLATRRRLGAFDCVIPGHGAWFDPRTGMPVGAATEEAHV